MRICKRCHESRDGSRFGVNKHGNLNGTCKDCVNTAKRAKYHADPQARRRMLDGQKSWKYGLSREAFDEMLASQGGGCAVCGATTPGGKGEWHIDHDHSCCNLPPNGSGRTCGRCTRGLLCSKCNVGLGAFDDDIDKMSAAMAYLMSSRDLLSGLTSKGEPTASVRSQRQSPI